MKKSFKSVIVGASFIVLTIILGCFVYIYETSRVSGIIVKELSYDELPHHEQERSRHLFDGDVYVLVKDKYGHEYHVINTIKSGKKLGDTVVFTDFFNSNGFYTL